MKGRWRAPRRHDKAITPDRQAVEEAAVPKQSFPFAAGRMAMMNKGKNVVKQKDLESPNLARVTRSGGQARGEVTAFRKGRGGKLSPDKCQSGSYSEIDLCAGYSTRWSSCYTDN